MPFSPVYGWSFFRGWLWDFQPSIFGCSQRFTHFFCSFVLCAPVNVCIFFSLTLCCFLIAFPFCWRWFFFFILWSVFSMFARMHTPSAHICGLTGWMLAQCVFFLWQITKIKMPDWPMHLACATQQMDYKNASIMNWTMDMDFSTREPKEKLETSAKEKKTTLNSISVFFTRFIPNENWFHIFNTGSNMFRLPVLSSNWIPFSFYSFIHLVVRLFSLDCRIVARDVASQTLLVKTKWTLSIYSLHSSHYLLLWSVAHMITKCCCSLAFRRFIVILNRDHHRNSTWLLSNCTNQHHVDDRFAINTI